MSAILETAARLVADVLAEHRFAIAEPVVARFRTADSGGTGVEIVVRLRDPVQAQAARAAILRVFPIERGHDLVTVT